MKGVGGCEKLPGSRFLAGDAQRTLQSPVGYQAETVSKTYNFKEDRDVSFPLSQQSVYTRVSLAKPYCLALTVSKCEDQAMTETGKLKNSKVLIVDDMASVRSVIKAYLFDLGLSQVTEAANGQKALALLLEHRFDLIISDWDMPVMNGLDMLKAVRADQRLGSIKFLMLTANAKAPMVQAAIAAGVSDYIIKPFTFQIFQFKIKRLLAT
jgi:two-component system chemotaxis response regulator CheY